LVYWFDRDFKHPITDSLPTRPGFHQRSKTVPGLDYIRGNLFDINDGTILPHLEPGERNDIIDYISPILNKAIEERATIYIFGEPFSKGEEGIHDVHMNQGNDGKFRESNGTQQDGGILLHFPNDDHWEGIFLAFGVQKPHTDGNGNPIGNNDFVDLLEGTDNRTLIDGTPPFRTTGGHELDDGTLPFPIFIRAALLNPTGPDQSTTGQPETVYLVNKSTRPVDLTGFSILNRDRAQQHLSGTIAGQSSKGLAVPNAPLSNNGGTISLLDGKGLKVHGVSYTRAQAKREGELVYFG
jgi:uncharacterized protein YukJ